VLLERIRAERGGITAAPTRRPRRTKPEKDGQGPRFSTIPMAELFATSPPDGRNPRSEEG
jgi:hypothetical protein